MCVLHMMAAAPHNVFLAREACTKTGQTTSGGSRSKTGPFQTLQCCTLLQTTICSTVPHTSGPGTHIILAVHSEGQKL